VLREVCLALENPRNPFAGLALKYDSRISVVGCKEIDSRTMALVIEVEGSDPDELLKDLGADASVRRVYPARRARSHRVLALVELRAPVYCTIVRDTGVVCVSCPFNTENHSKTRWRLLVRDSTASSKLLELAIRHSLSAAIEQVSAPRYAGMLTPRQRQVVLTAMKAGYFDFPRRINLTTLAERLSIKPSTLSEILRSAEYKMAKDFLERMSSRVFPEHASER